MKTFFRHVLLASSISFLISTNPLFAQQIQKKIEKAFQKFQNQDALKNGLASLTVIDSKTGKTLFAQNEHIGMATASTMKVITSATALEILGQDYQFTTTLYYSGTLDNDGVLDGNIVVAGTGDPTLGSSRYPETTEKKLLQQWVEAIKKAGIKSIRGSVIGDDRLYKGNQIPGGWIWTDMGNYYGAGISSLNWRENAVGVKFEAGYKPGDPAAVTEMTVPVPYLNIINQTTTGDPGSGDNVYAYSAPYSSKIFLRGTYGKDLKKTIEISVPDPAYDLAYQLTTALEQNEVKVEEGPANGEKMRLTDLSKKDTLAVHLSPSLAKIVYWFNQKSINLYGEALAKAIAYHTAQKVEALDGPYYVQQHWNSKLNITTGELHSVDGSGLSPQNRVTTSAMNRIMQYAQQQPWYPVFYESLPTFNGMKMKSGTIEGALGYTGVYTNKAGQSFTFTLLVNNFTGSGSAMRKQMFELLDVLK